LRASRRAFKTRRSRVELAFRPVQYSPETGI
jgi:hypothetical protein